MPISSLLWSQSLMPGVPVTFEQAKTGMNIELTLEHLKGQR